MKAFLIAYPYSYATKKNYMCILKVFYYSATIESYDAKSSSTDTPHLSVFIEKTNLAGQLQQESSPDPTRHSMTFQIQTRNNRLIPKLSKYFFSKTKPIC